MISVPENRAKRKLVLELSIIIIFGIAIYMFAAHYDILEKAVKFSRSHEDWELDEIITTSFFFVFAMAVFSVRRWIELRKALSEIRRLKGILPICSACKKIRDDVGCWHQIESYVCDHTEAEFSHGMCPDCVEQLYPDFVNSLKEEDKPS